MNIMRIYKIINGDNMNKPNLIIMIGISASGKSTIAKQIAEKENCVIVSSDGVRAEICEGGVSDQSKNEEVFKIFHRIIRENLLKGNNVIADATSITLKSRRAIFDVVRGIDCYKIGYLVVKGIEDCIKDNKNDDRVAVPDEVIYKQVKKFQVPFIKEGYTKILIDGLIKDRHANYLKTEHDLYDKMKVFDQKTPYHNQTLFEHCKYTAEMFKKYCYPDYYIHATMLHDFAKMYTQTFDENGVAHYYGHENLAAYLLLTDYYNVISCDSYYSEQKVLDMLVLVNYHMLPMNWNTDKAKEKWRNIFGDYRYQLLVDFNKCDKMRPDDNNKLSEL